MTAPVPLLDLGKKLRTLRQTRGLSLNSVAEGSGLSSSFISLVETGRSDISLTRLIRLAGFYAVNVSDLLPAVAGQDPHVVRRNEGMHLYSPAEGINLFLLAPDTERVMMPLLIECEPGGGHADYTKHDGQEFIHVLEGKVALDVEGEKRLILSKGDSAYYRSDRNHSFRNIGTTRARIIAVVTPPTL